MSIINRLAGPTFSSSAAAGIDVIELAIGNAHPGERGYFTLLKEVESDPVTVDKAI